MPSVKKACWTQVINIHCCCRIPYALKSNSVSAGEVTEMIQCKFALSCITGSYHHYCVNLIIEKVKKYTKEFWMCDQVTMFAMMPLQIHVFSFDTDSA